MAPMRKNLTISLESRDWALVRAWAKALGKTYSGVFRQIISERAGGVEVNSGTIARYKPLFDADRDFFAGRAAAFTKAALSRKRD